MDAVRPLIAGNWKMHKTHRRTTAFVRELLALRTRTRCRRRRHLSAVYGPARGRRSRYAAAALGLGAQTMSGIRQGAFTGEISALMLLEFGVRWVILGHSERRAYCGETDAAVNRKVHTALRVGITPIVCVGETADEHAAGRTHAHVVAQVDSRVR